MRFGCVLGPIGPFLPWRGMDDLSIKRLKPNEELREQNDDVTSEEPAARLDADFAPVTTELSQFTPALFTALLWR